MSLLTFSITVLILLAVGASVCGQDAQETGQPVRAEVPPGFMLTFTMPGCDPGEDCDDVGPPLEIRRKWFEQSGCNMASFGIGWGDTEKSDPGDGPSSYDFSGAKPDPFTLKQKHIICNLHFFGNPWAERFRFTDKERYNKLLERWAEAACKFARETYGVTIFETGGNERDLVAPETYRPHYPDWYQFYMDPVIAISKGLKKANKDNKLIIGNFCFTDRAHVSCIYLAGGKGHFDILAIHAYGARGQHVDMEQVLDAREELDSHGDTHIPILMVEGWSSFPLPVSIEKDQRWRGGARPYTDAEIEHYRQTVLDGWRNLTMERPGFFDPKWMIGAHYFVLNDHWGGRGWAKRGKPQYDEQGKLKGFLLDGYYIGTTDPDYLKPILRPWGLIDIDGNPKGDAIKAFPPYIPKHSFTAALREDLKVVPYDLDHQEWTCKEVEAGKTYRVSVTFANKEDTPMTGCRFSLSEKSDKDFPGGYAFAFVQGKLHTNEQPSSEHLVKAKLLSSAPPDTIGPGESVRMEYEITFDPKLAVKDGSVRKRVRPLCDLYYVWRGRPYHTDAWLPRVVVKG